MQPHQNKPPLESNSSKQSQSDFHRASIEILRILACFGIVWFHAHAPFAEVGYAGLPVFVAISVALTMQSKSSAHPLASIRNRARRLLWPWILCSLIYGIWRIFGNVRAGREIFATFDYWMLITGTVIHLWYLPFIFLISCIIIIYKPNLCFGQLNSIASVLAAAGIIFCSWMESQDLLRTPFNCWLFCVPAIFIGLALPLTNDLGQQTRQLLLLLTCVLPACLFVSISDYKNMAIPYSVGTIALAIAWVIPFAASAKLKRIAGMTFDVYLMHIMFLSLLMTSTGIPHGAVAAVLTWVGTSSLVWLYKNGSVQHYLRILNFKYRE